MKTMIYRFAVAISLVILPAVQLSAAEEWDYSLYIGGIVGYTTDNATVTGCSFEGKIYGNYNHPYLGGIVGYHNSYKGISDCHASGYLSGTVGQPLNNSSKYLGGIAGYSYSAITACTAAVNTNPGNDYSGYYIGGIVGECRTNVVDCITYGSDANGNPCTVIGYDCENVGGIAGKAASVSLCRNYANVQCINKNMKVGGIVGVCSTVEYSGNFGCVYGTDDNECNGGVNILYVDFILTSTVDNLQGDNSAAIIYATKGAAVIESSVQGIAAVYSTSGALLKQVNVAESGRTAVPLAPGIYFVKLGSTTAKIIVR